MIKINNYNVFSLFVVSANIDNKERALICRYNKENDDYVEVFTNLKVEINSETIIKPLFSIKGLIDMKRERYIKKENILEKYFVVNSINWKENNYSNDYEETISILKDITDKFFETDGEWAVSCLVNLNDYSKSHIPNHLYDDEWLAQALCEMGNLYYINFNDILKFVKYNSYFKTRKKEYEQKIVKKQIENMEKGSPKAIIPDNYKESEIRDILIRNSIVDTLSAIGISKDAIEEGLEKNHSLWREQEMEKTFKNIYENSDNSESISPLFKEKWLKLRRYEYYQDHKDSIDKYGSLVDDMLISEDEAMKLKEEFNNKNIMVLEKKS